MMKASLICLFLLLATQIGVGAAPTTMATTPFESPAAFRQDTQIDRLVFARLNQLGIQPANLCSDAVFVRRVHLDVIGMLPTAQETKDFLQDRNPDKRRILIDRYSHELPWPCLTMVGDVCRDDLLFEIEVTACPNARKV